MSDTNAADPLSDFTQPDADFDPDAGSTDNLESETDPTFPQRDYATSGAEGESAAEEDAEKDSERDD